MADFDINSDGYNPGSIWPPRGLKPTVVALKAALTTFNATSYTADRLYKMSENDMLSACRQHGLAVVGL